MSQSLTERNREKVFTQFDKGDGPNEKKVYKFSKEIVSPELHSQWMDLVEKYSFDRLQRGIIKW